LSRPRHVSTQTLLDVLKRDAQSACRIAKPFFYAIDWLPLVSVLATYKAFVYFNILTRVL
jgi:hypothetical protein